MSSTKAQMYDVQRAADFTRRTSASHWSPAVAGRQVCLGGSGCCGAARRQQLDDSQDGLSPLWPYDQIRRSVSTPSVHEGLIYWPDFSGFLHCLDQKTGQAYLTHDMFAAIWGSPMVADAKVYLGDEDGNVAVLQPGQTLKVLAESNMGSSVYSSPVAVGHTLFITSRNQLQPLVRARREVAPPNRPTSRLTRAGYLAVSGPSVVGTYPPNRGVTRALGSHSPGNDVTSVLAPDIHDNEGGTCQ